MTLHASSSLDSSAFISACTCYSFPGALLESLPAPLQPVPLSATQITSSSAGKLSVVSCGTFRKPSCLPVDYRLCVACPLETTSSLPDALFLLQPCVHQLLPLASQSTYHIWFSHSAVPTASSQPAPPHLFSLGQRLSLALHAPLSPVPGT